MPRMSGLEVCKQLKAKRPSIPIIMLTARGQEIDKVVGLELGADDYVTKPFSIRELMARVKAVLRRSQTAPKEQEATGSVTSRSTSGATRLRARQAARFRRRSSSCSSTLLPSRRNAEPRPPARRGVGLRQLPDHPHGGHAHRSLEAKVEPRPEEPRFIVTVHGTGYKFVG